MSKGTISLSFTIADGGDGLRKLTMDAKALRDVMRGTLTEAQRARQEFRDFAVESIGFDAITGSLGELKGMVDSLSGAYAVQEEAETKIETVMRRRMNATAEEIQSIKDLCSAQQQLGVVGDEVQLAGAQQIATFLTTRGALEELIPAMNNLAAQQKGFNVTSSDAVNIGNLLGKAMQGQTSALRRVGITFSEAEEQAVKYGTEQERAAALARIITSNVGEMNAALAATPAGSMKQLSNNVGDLQERMGAVARHFQSGLMLMNQMATGIANVRKVAQGLNTVPTYIRRMYTEARSASVEIRLLGRTMTATGAASKTMAVLFKGAMMTMKTALISTGVGVALLAIGEALSFIVEKLNGVEDAAESAGKSIEKLTDNQDEETRAMTESTAQITRHIAELRNWKGSKEQEARKVEELNGLYGETMGRFSSVKAWYDKLTSSSKLYVQQMVLEAKARTLANQVGQLEADYPQVFDRPSTPAPAPETPRPSAPAVPAQVQNSKPASLPGASVPALTPAMPATGGWELPESSKNTMSALITGFNSSLIEKRDALVARMEEVQRQLGENAAQLMTGMTPEGGGGGGGKPDASVPEGSKADYEQQISRLERQISVSVDPQSIAEMMRQIEALRARIEGLEIEARVVLYHDEFERRLGEFDRSLSPVSLPVEAKIDTGGLKEVDLGASQWYQDFDKSQKEAEKLNKQLSAMSQIGQQVGSAFSSMGQIMESEELNVAGIIAGAIANILAGYAAASAQSAQLGPWGWAAFSIAGLAQALAMVAQLKQATAFAQGGIVSGPTMALVGEYAGARNNPEVIAPLDKLRSLLPEGGPGGVTRVEVTGRLRGRDIELSMANTRNIARASGRNRKI